MEDIGELKQLIKKYIEVLNKTTESINEIKELIKNIENRYKEKRIILPKDLLNLYIHFNFREHYLNFDNKKRKILRNKLTSMFSIHFIRCFITNTKKIPVKHFEEVYKIINNLKD